MPNSKKVVKTIRMTAETNEKFETAFEESNVDSKGEFIDSLIDQALNDEPTIEVEEIEIEVEKKLEPNQILISLTPAQMFALHGHVSEQEFAEKQNRIINKLSNKPWYASSDIYKPEFQQLWTPSIELKEQMDETERGKAIKNNMGAFLANMFLTNLIDSNIPESAVSIEDIETFILEQSELENTKEDENAA
ncbi:MAG: hypothetical protein HQ522_10765 [Bacteroidetes bacterium]|nr:hypothetical protein [Bacteroidota bacterium]